jgi:starch synthase
MPADPVSVTVALGTAPYQKTLAASLLSAGMLRQVIDLAPYIGIREPNSQGKLERVKSFPGYTLTKRIVWGIWRRLPRSSRPRPPAFSSVWLADRLLSNSIAPCTIFHGCTALSLATIRAAKQRGAITLVEHAASHPREWKKVEIAECQRFGVNRQDGSGDQPERLLRRMEQEFRECDRIVVPSGAARRSFAEYGNEAKTVVVPTGVDAEFFSPGQPAAHSAIFRVCYVGRIEFAKGVGYLLEAWKRLGLAGAELVLVGEVKLQMKTFLKGYEGCGVRCTGMLPPLEVARVYRESNLFAMPSPCEGLAQVVLEAMASGLAVVATDTSGANECVIDRKEGFVVPARDVDAIANAILECYEHRDETQSMGRAARARIENQFTLKDYNNRVINLYSSLAASA